MLFERERAKLIGEINNLAIKLNETKELYVNVSITGNTRCLTVMVFTLDYRLSRKIIKRFYVHNCFVNLQSSQDHKVAEKNFIIKQLHEVYHYLEGLLIDE